MPEPQPVIIPMLNPNEVEARLVSVAVREGQSVQEGDSLATLETTKSISELTVPSSGFIRNLRYQEGETVRAGDLLCFVSDSLEAVLPAAWQPAPEDTKVSLPAGLRMTKPALELAERTGIDISELPQGVLITETALRKLLPELQDAETLSKVELAPQYDQNAIVIYGGGGHGKMVIDLLHMLGSYQVIGVVDDGMAGGEDILGVPVLGKGDLLSDLRARGLTKAVNAIGGIGNISIRIKIFERIAQEGLSCPALVHSKATVEPSAELSHGVQVFAHAYIGSAARVGYGTIINSGVILSHDCQIGDYANISPGAILAGSVEVGERAMIGMGVTLNLGVKIGAGARLGNSATIKSDVPAGGVVRAGKIWPEG